MCHKTGCDVVQGKAIHSLLRGWKVVATPIRRRITRPGRTKPPWLYSPVSLLEIRPLQEAGPVAPRRLELAKYRVTVREHEQKEFGRYALDLESKLGR